MDHQSKPTTGRQEGQGPVPLSSAADDAARPFDRALLHRRRSRVAGQASSADFLLHRVADDLADRLEIVQRTFPLAANIGAHHGVLSRRLRQVSSVGVMCDVEPVAELLAQCDGPRLQADEEALPFAAGSLDLAVSALSLHLVNDLPGTLIQIRRALKPDGLFMAALLGGATLGELGQAWLTAEAEMTGGASPRVSPSIEVRELGGLLQRAGFALPVVDSETITVAYATPLALMRDVKAMGASNFLNARRRAPVRRDVLVRTCEIYAERFARADGKVIATFEVLSATAWAPDASQQKPLQPGSAQMRLADALGVKEGGG
ncbi:MAG: methyltransferase domain-containing protein [Hyphomicrobiaceae bacterium]